jgi:hypothetical protein
LVRSAVADMPAHRSEIAARRNPTGVPGGSSISFCNLIGYKNASLQSGTVT